MIMIIKRVIFPEERFTRLTKSGHLTGRLVTLPHFIDKIVNSF